MATKKIKRRKFNFTKFLIFIVIVLFILFIGYKIYKLPIRNIVVLNNNYLTDEEIIEKAKLEEYPSFIKTLKLTTKRRIKKIKLVKDVKIKKKLNRKFIIDIEEYKVLYLVRSTGLYKLEDGTDIELETDLSGIPTLINYCPDEIIEKLTKKLSTLEIDVISKISEIEYSPTDYDDERFLLYMNDDNLVYITLNKIKEFSKYIDIKTQLQGKKGILYLDSGNYFEIKE